MIKQGIDKAERFDRLKQIAEYQLRVLTEAEAIQKIKLLSPFERAAIVEIMEFFVWKNQRKKSHIA